MTRIKRLIRPDTQALNWKAAIPVLGLAVATLLTASANASPDAPQAGQTRARADFGTCAKPIWPRESLRREHQGAVTLSFHIGADGKAKDSAVKQSSGYPALDEAARVGIAKCSFKPATVGGQPVEGWMDMKYVWTLK